MANFNNAPMHDSESEQAILATLFQDPDAIDMVSDLLAADEFYDPRHELIYGSAMELHMRGEKFGPIQVYTKLRVHGELERAGGLEYISSLVNPTSISAYGADPLNLAANIKDSARRRKLHDAAMSILDAGQFGSGLSGSQAIEYAEQQVQNLMNEESVSSEITTVAELFDGVLEDFRRAAEMPDGVELGINTGFTDLDTMLGGLRGTRLYYLAARPGSGKTTLALDIARSAVFLQGMTVLFFSLEMSEKEVVEKAISAEARVELKKLQSGNLTDEDWFNIREAEQRLRNGNFLIDPSPNVGLPKIRTLAIRQKARPEGLDMIIIDYLQLMEVGHGTSKNASRQEQVSELSRGMKLLAKEVDVPIIVLSQLNRGPENRVDGEPKVSDLRESGSLEQDADVVILINRPEVNDPNNRPGETDVIVGKNRHGPQGRVKLTSMLAYSKFVNSSGSIAREPVIDEEGNQLPTDQAGDDEIPW